MNFRYFFAVVAVLILLDGLTPAHATESVTALEKNMSDTLDVWREGRYEQLFDLLAHRGKTSREAFVRKMHDATIKPACCWQKMEHFKVLNEKRTEATVYAKIGLEGAGAVDSATREYKMTHQDGVWKMQLADVFSLAGVTGKKGNSSKRHVKKNSVSHN